MQLQVELAELERASPAAATAADDEAAEKAENEEMEETVVDGSVDANGTVAVEAVAPGERAELQQDPHRGERVFLELQLRLLFEQEAAFKGALEGLATAVNQGNRTIGDVLEIFQRRARESHRAALQADLLYLESLDRGADTGNSTAQDAIAVRQRRGGDLLESVGKAADELEQGLEEHTFDRAQLQESAHLETVVRLIDEDLGLKVAADGGGGGGRGPADAGAPAAAGAAEHEATDEAAVLIDAASNLYVLAKPKDSTVPYEDVHLLMDLIKVLGAAWVAGVVVSQLGLPVIFGSIVAGIALGPSGLNTIRSLVQLETIAQFGIFLILFVLGLEFSVAHLQGTWREALQSALGQMTLILGGVVFGSRVLPITFSEAVVVGICCALSSTAVVVTVLRPSDLDAPEGRSIVGVLVMQDVLVGLLLAAVPLLLHPPDETLAAVALMGKNLVIFTVIAVVAARVMSSMAFRNLVMGKRETTVMALLAQCLAMMSVASYLGLSMELGSFVAGLQVSVRHTSAERPVALLAPLRDVFSALFFAAIGLHVYPQFLVQEWRLLVSLAAIIVAAKLALGFVVYRIFFRHSRRSALRIALALAQLSEFGFVVAARAKVLGVLSREVYHLLIGTTALTLLATPLLWRLATSGGSIGDGGGSSGAWGSSGGGAGAAGGRGDLNQGHLLPRTRPVED